MNKFSIEKFIRQHNLYHRLIYIFVIISAFLDRFVTKNLNTVSLVCVCIIMALFFVLDILFDNISIFEKPAIATVLRMIEMVSCCAIEFFLDFKFVLLYAMCIVYLLFSLEFITVSSDDDNGNYKGKKIIFIIVSAINICISYLNKSDSIWIGYAMVKALAIIIVLFIVDYLIEQDSIYTSIFNKQKLEISNYEDSNNKLREYQQRIKETNEQINYQKIDLTRAYKDLEQINVETNSQTELMKYMSSTFDIQKCLNLLVDTVMEVKEPKLCAVYITENVYSNSEPTLVLKTNYSSVQRRLKKEIDNLFKQFSMNNQSSVVLYNANELEYKFLNDTNINTLALLPIMNNKQNAGIMIVASDNKDFFDKGLSYYESCILELVVSIKSTNMYLKMQDMARKDGLTGIYNRIYFNELFAKAAKHAKSKSQDLSVALYDIDKFKNVNDTYGHLAGDMVIKMVASVGNKYAEKYNGIACRYGGEEFLLVLPKKDKNQAMEILSEMHKEIQDTIVTYNNTVITVNVCIGLTSYPELCDDPDHLVSRADNAMYYGKKNGRGRLVLDSPELDEE